MNGNQIQDDSQQKSRVTATSFAAKFKSKREVYFFLTVDVKAYLPPFENTSIYWLKDIISGEKKYIHQDDVKHITMPYYKGITLKNIFEVLGNYPALGPYAPDAKDVKRLPREWVGNLGYTIIGEPFA